jgi:hypothetical protein
LEVASAQHAAELAQRESEMHQLQATASAQHSVQLLRESELQQLQAELVGGVAMQCSYEAFQACRHVFAHIFPWCSPARRKGGAGGGNRTARGGGAAAAGFVRRLWGLYRRCVFAGARLRGKLMPGTVQEKTRLNAEALRKHEERAHWEWVPVAAAADTRQQEEFAAAGVNLTAAQLRAQLARCVER